MEIIVSVFGIIQLIGAILAMIYFWSALFNFFKLIITHKGITFPDIFRDEELYKEFKEKFIKRIGKGVLIFFVSGILFIISFAFEV